MIAEARPDEAVATLLDRIARGERPTAALLALGRHFAWHGDFDLAHDCFARAHRIDPEDPSIRRSLGLALCRRGDLAQGLAHYEARWRLEEFRPVLRPFPHPVWQGEELRGKRILLWAEQGVGDQLMQARCLAAVLKSGAQATVECDPRLIPLLARSFAGIEWVPQYVDPSAVLRDRAFEIQASLLSAWRWTIPDALRAPSPAYIAPDPGLVDAYRKTWRQRGWTINLGLSWRSRAKKIGAEKSIDPALLRPVLADPRLTLHSLQYGADRDEVGALGRSLGRPVLMDAEGDPLNNLDRLAAQIRALDLAVSIDNATVHFAGSMGVPCWTLLPCGNDWRWGEQGETTPLYPNMRLFRQRSRGAWGDVVARAAFAMAAWLAGRDGA